MTVTKDQLLASAQQLHDQAEYLLDDEVGYATGLRESRKTATTLVLLVIGIGLFRLELFRPTQLVLVVPHWSAVTIRFLFLVAVGFLISGTYMVYTERSLHREFAKPKVPPNGEGTSGGGGALSILNLRQSVLDDFMQKEPLEVIRMKTDGVRLAYSRLRKANRRVRKRLAMGTGLVFIGLLFVFLAFAFYTCTVDINAERGVPNETTKAQGPITAPASGDGKDR